MNTINFIPVIYEKLSIFILVSSRISALFFAFVLFRRDFVSSKIIIALVSILTFYVMMLHQDFAISKSVISFSIIPQIAFQFLIGFMAGLILNIVFEVAVCFGQIVSTQTGLSMASLIDPSFGNITSLTQFYTYLTIMIFLSLNGHLLMIKVIINSFSVISINENFIPLHLISTILDYSGVIFSGAVKLSFAVIISILLCNLALGVMVRFAPQFNFYSIGVNITLIFGLIFLYLMFYIFTNKISIVIDNGILFLKHAL